MGDIYIGGQVMPTDREQRRTFYTDGTKPIIIDGTNCGFYSSGWFVLVEDALIGPFDTKAQAVDCVVQPVKLVAGRVVAA